MLDEAAADGGEGEGARQQQQHHHHGRRAAGRTRLGLVWEGVRGRLRLRREAPGPDDGRKQSLAADKKPPGGVDRPSRDEVLASYHHLVSAGFFAEHAVYSTRRPPPGTVAARPASAHEPRAGPGHHHHHHPRPPHPFSPPPPPCPDREAPPPPQWPLAPRTTRPSPARPVCSPASLASSRGTKRPAVDDDDDDDADADGDVAAAEADWESARSPPDPQVDDEDVSTLAHRFLPKRVRRSASRDISLPKIRAPRRSLSAAAITTTSTTTTTVGATPSPRRNPPRRLVRLALPVNVPGTAPPPAADADADDDAAAAPRRQRNLRPRVVGGPLSVVPDANRGIPSVPAIPAKYARAGGLENDHGPRGELHP